MAFRKERKEERRNYARAAEKNKGVTNIGEENEGIIAEEKRKRRSRNKS